MSAEIRYSFPDQRFNVGNSNLKTIGTSTEKYFKIDYPGDANPVIRYDGKLYYPLSIAIIKSPANEIKFNYYFILETVSKVNNASGNKLFVQIKLVRDATAADGPLTPLFDAIKNASTTNVNVNLTGLFADSAMKTAKIYGRTSSDLTLQCSGVIATKIEDLSSITANDVSKVYTNIPQPSVNDNGIAVSVVASQLRQVNKCTRSSDMGSPSSFSLKKEVNASNVMSNIMVLTIIGLAMAAFFPMIYSGLVCIPAGDNGSKTAIHIFYLICSLLIVIPLFVRGFKDGDMDAQIWGLGIIGIMLIFFWQFSHLATDGNLRCNVNTVENASIYEQVKNFFSALKSNRWVILVIVIIGIFTIASSSVSSDDKAFRGLVITQAILTLAGAYGFRA